MSELSRFSEIALDWGLHEKIIRDMQAHGGSYIPSSHWMAVEEKNMDDLGLMLDSFIGNEGSKKISDQEKATYEKMFLSVDLLNLRSRLGNEALVDDYGIAMDINLIAAFYGSLPSSFKVLEIGGGYGALAEAMYRTYQGRIKYVLVDAVPKTIAYSYQYLSLRLPEAKIGSYFHDPTFNLENYDIFIIPAWRFADLNRAKYDIAINVHSFQEMNQTIVDQYMLLIDECLSPDGLVYFENSHEFVFKGKWNYPKSWQCQFRYNTPRSWTVNHPTEIYRKKQGDFSKTNQIIEYFSFFDAERRSQINKDLLKEIQDLYQKISYNEERIRDLDKCFRDSCERLEQSRNNTLRNRLNRLFAYVRENRKNLPIPLVARNED